MTWETGSYNARGTTNLISFSPNKRKASMYTWFHLKYYDHTEDFKEKDQRENGLE